VLVAYWEIPTGAKEVIEDIPITTLIHEQIAKFKAGFYPHTHKYFTNSEYEITVKMCLGNIIIKAL